MSSESGAVPEPGPADDGAPTVRDSSATPVLEGAELRKVFVSGDGSELVVLDGVGIAVRRGEVVAIVGQSGAGKSTLLHLLGGLDRPSGGTVALDGQALERLGDDALAEIRNRKIGFVFQFHHLLREFNAQENVMMPQLIAGVGQAEAERRSRELLDGVGLAQRLSHKPWQLSGGEQQRVAVARALANRPAVLLADEPSGNLDAHTSDRLHDLFFRLREEHGVAMIIATHNRELADRADRVMRLQQGRLTDLYSA